MVINFLIRQMSLARTGVVPLSAIFGQAGRVGVQEAVRQLTQGYIYKKNLVFL